MKTNQRLLGIDLIKGFAAFAVAILHSGDVTNSKTVDFWATQLQRFCGFAVPFFLIASFFLLINRMYCTGKTYSFQNRFHRLFVPYIIWSLIYLFLRVFKFLVLKEAEGFERISDITSLIFFGSSGLPLYFLPLLMTGMLSLGFIQFLIKKRISPLAMLIAFLLSIFLENIIFVTGNAFQLGPNVAFRNLVSSVFPDGNQSFLIRVVLVYTAWLIKCLPYIFAAMMLNYFLFISKHLKLSRNLMVYSLLGFISINIVYFCSISNLNNPIYIDFQPPIYEVLKAIPLLLFAICFSIYIPSSAFIESIGLCSFGIYLIHQPIIQVIKAFIGKIFPDFAYNVSVPSQLFFGFLAFLSAWLITHLLMRHTKISKILFGT